MKQRTLHQPFKFDGIGLHTGKQVVATFNPAPPDTGIIFKRVDVPQQPIIPASVNYITGTERGTVVQKDNYRISTIEHAMSALYAFQISNCIIEVQGEEIPILDGSGALYTDAISRVGVVEQDELRKTWVVDREYDFSDGDSRLVVRPCEHYCVKVKIRFPSVVVGEQTASLDNLQNYPQQVASARTFCFVREIEPLLQNNLIRGGDLTNALVIYDQPISQERMDALTDKLGKKRLDAAKLGYLSDLRYENEPAVHKLLDLMGDLALLGVFIQGEITAECPGHGFNAKCGKYLSPYVKF